MPLYRRFILMAAYCDPFDVNKKITFGNQDYYLLYLLHILGFYITTYTEEEEIELNDENPTETKSPDPKKRKKISQAHSSITLTTLTCKQDRFSSQRNNNKYQSPL